MKIKLTLAVGVIMSLLFSNVIDVHATSDAEATSGDYETITLDHPLSFTDAALNDPIDGIWQGNRENNDNGGALESHQEGITGNGTSIKLSGYSSGNNVQYAYANLDELHNKLIKFKMVFDGELENADGSFIAFALRASGFSSNFYWNDNCYSVLLKGGKAEAHKHPQRVSGVNNNLGGEKGNVPVIKKLDTVFGPGTYDVEIGALDGISPTTNQPSVNIIFRLNGEELFNIWDDSGRTPTIDRQGYFLVALCHTQKDIEGDSASRSSLTLMSPDADDAAIQTATEDTGKVDSEKVETDPADPVTEEKEVLVATPEVTQNADSSMMLYIAIGAIVLLAISVLIIIIKKKKV